MKKARVASYPNIQLTIETKSDDVLFHYTNIDAIFSIFKQEKLWFSKSDYLNDPAEAYYMQDILVEISEELFPNEPNNEFNNQVSNLFSKDHPFPQNVYILSLTDNHDSLTLWSNYSEFVGYNIGINISSLLHSLEDQAIYYKHGKVIYNKKRQKDIIKHELIHAHEKWKSRNTDSERLIVINELFNRVFFYSIFFKKAPFYQEEEYRIAILLPNEAVIPKTELNNRFPVCFRTYNEVLIPYIEVPILNNKGYLPIESITIGPKNTIDIATEGLKYFLQTKDYHFVKVRKSNIHLRY